jgi:hypothetical protein
MAKQNLLEHLDGKYNAPCHRKPIRIEKYHVGYSNIG